MAGTEEACTIMFKPFYIALCYTFDILKNKAPRQWGLASVMLHKTFYSQCPDHVQAQTHPLLTS